MEVIVSNDEKRVSLATLLIGTVLSAAMGVFFYYRTDLNAAFATFAGLLGTAITLQVEMIGHRYREDSMRTKQQRLIASLDRTRWAFDLLEKMMSSIEDINQQRSKVLDELAHRSMEDCIQNLNNLASGRFENKYDDFWLLFTLTENAERSIRTTSFGRLDLEWWSSAGGQAYWRLQCRAIERGITVRRIFIFDDWTAAHEKLVEMQRSRGVHTMRVKATDLPLELRIDVILWDEKCVYQTRLNSAASSSGSAAINTYDFTPRTISLINNRYELIESCAEAWPSLQKGEGSSDQ